MTFNLLFVHPKVVLILAVYLSTPLSFAEQEKPLWELGLGAASVSFPAYRGSDQRNTIVLPAPYLVYRGKFLKADRAGFRAELFDSERVELTLSAALSPPASSQAIPTREGMPDLKANVELGPQLNFTLWRSNNYANTLTLLLPVRKVWTLERESKNIGWIAHPKLNLDLSGLTDLPDWKLGLQVGPLYSDRKQQAYFYDVDSAYATANRPAYAAKGGFAGVQYTAALSKRYPKYWIGAFARYDNLSGASFADSPLVRTKHYVSAGVAISWIFAESAMRVSAND